MSLHLCLLLSICFILLGIILSKRHRCRPVFIFEGIPNVIYMTTGIDLKHVPDLLKDTAVGYDVHVYNDEACHHFLLKYWGEKILMRFNSLKQGAHKMDLWRYCMLYLRGGIYLDIKTVPIKKIDEVFTQKNTWYTCLSAVRGCYQGIIATPPGNEILLECIRMILETSDKDLDSEYLLFTIQMHNICKKVYNSQCNNPGLYEICNKTVKAPNLVLFEEACSIDECRYTRQDRYGLCCNIRDKYKNHLFRTRHGKYPWIQLPTGEKSILTHSNIQIF